jgi:hypothetical protein
VLLPVLSVACNTPLEVRPEAEIRVLVIGNSLLALHDVPLLVQGLADAAGLPVEVVDRATPGRLLRDHWNNQTTRSLLEHQGPWSLVILQETAVVSDTGRVYLQDYVSRFTGATPAPVGLLSLWPPDEDLSWDAIIEESFAGAARQAGARLIPTAAAWRIARERNPHLLLNSEGLYPSPAGAYLTALVLLHAATGESPLGLPSRLSLRYDGEFAIDDATARFLQECAEEATRPRP